MDLDKIKSCYQDGINCNEYVPELVYSLKRTIAALKQIRLGCVPELDADGDTVYKTLRKEEIQVIANKAIQQIETLRKENE